MASSPRAWPYASNSVGPFRGSLRIGGRIRTLLCFAACGEARDEFNGFIPDIKTYLQNNLSRESTQGVVISLYMIGKQPSRTKPTILFASDDKLIRKEAFSLIKDQSCIMEQHPGFEIGHIPLKAEFEGLQQMADDSEAAVYWPQDVSFYHYKNDWSSPHDLQFTSTTQDALVGPESLATTTVSGLIESANPGCERPISPNSVSETVLASTSTASGKKTKSVFVELGSSTGCQKLHVSVDGAEQNKRSATAGGLVSFRGRLMLQTVQHLLEETASPTISRDVSDEGTYEGTDDCEITGWSDSEGDDDEPDLADITSRGSVSPQSEAPESAASDTVADEASTVFSGPAQEDHANELRSRLRELVPSRPLQVTSADQHNGVTAIGEVVLSSREWDFALVEVPPSVVPKLGGAGEDQSRPIPLENCPYYVEPAPRDAAIKVTTPEGGSIGGTLSGTPSLFRPTGSLTFIEVYTAKLNRSLVPGDCGSWLRDAVSGKVYGHVIAGSPSTGLVLIVPAHQVLRLALESLSQDLWDGATSEPVSDLAYAFRHWPPLEHAAISGQHADERTTIDPSRQSLRPRIKTRSHNWRRRKHGNLPLRFRIETAPFSQPTPKLSTSEHVERPHSSVNGRRPSVGRDADEGEKLELTRSWLFSGRTESEGGRREAERKLGELDPAENSEQREEQETHPRPCRDNLGQQRDVLGRWENTEYLGEVD
ncbi:hypothetical protein C8034_v008389 [Colletotrichum sidae]|uniref:Uncharacterized protein n=1 Tax=Colletotrichum sidae TaxID=1347389 RepID=A0A4R8TMC5_9PEZI|nr:hypothetical protein C8034_v008389 [Colletotrichum sidae]